MIRRARLLCVLGVLVAGGIGILSSTQTWLVAVLAGPSATEIAVSGADAVPVLAPLSLATLALGLALSIVGTLLRFVFGALTVAIATILLVVTAPIVFGSPVSAVAAPVTEATGLSGVDAVAGLVSSIRDTPWPAVTLVGGVLLAVSGLFILATGRIWRGSGRRFRTDADHAIASEGPLDAIDSWDDLSRGDDPTASGAPR